MHIAEPQVTPLCGRIQVSLTKTLHASKYFGHLICGQIKRGDITGGHRAEAHLGKTKIVVQVIEDRFNIGNTPGQRDPTTDWTSGVTGKQHLHFLFHHLICPLATDSNPVFIVHRLRAIH